MSFGPPPSVYTQSSVAADQRRRKRRAVLLVYRRSGVFSPASVVSWDPRTDKETPYLLFTMPGDHESELSDPEASDILVENGRVSFSRRTAVRDDEYPKDPVLLSTGYGSAGLEH